LFQVEAVDIRKPNHATNEVVQASFAHFLHQSLEILHRFYFEFDQLVGSFHK
jgi:hypothetical protein